MYWEIEYKNGKKISEGNKKFSQISHKNVRSVALKNTLNNDKIFFDDYGMFNVNGNELFTLVVAGSKEYKLLNNNDFNNVVFYKDGYTDVVQSVKGMNGLYNSLPKYNIGFSKTYNFDDINFDCEYILSYDEETNIIKLYWSLVGDRSQQITLVIQYNNMISKLPVYMLAGQKMVTDRIIGLL